MRKCDLNGAFIWSSSVPSHFWQTHGITVDTDGYVRVCEGYLGKVYKYDISGNYISSWDYPDAFLVATDPDGYLWVSRYDSSNVEQFTNGGIPTGRIIEGDPGDTSVKALEIDREGNIFVGTSGSSKVRKYNRDLELLAEWGGFGEEDGKFCYIRGIAIDLDGYVFVTDLGPNRVQVFSPLIQATIDADPDTLNLKSKGKWITCYIELPEGYDESDNDVSSILLEFLLEVQHSEVQDDVLMVKFDRQDIIWYIKDVLQIQPPADVTLMVTGELTDGTPFEGTDTIAVIDKGGKK